MIELRLWRSFVAVAEELNFRRAAERLNISQPALTKQIQDLEARLGVPLFRREPHGVELTEAAITCLDQVRSMLDQAISVEEAFKNAQRSSEAIVRLGLHEFFMRTFVPPVLSKMRSQAPDVKVDIVELKVTEVSAAAADGKIDVGIARGPVTEQNLVARPFRRGTWALTFPVGHRLEKKKELSPGDLRDYPLIMFSRRLNDELFDSLVNIIEGGQSKIEIAYQTHDPMIAIELALSGIGLALTPSFLIDPLPSGLVTRPVMGLGPEPSLDLVWRNDRMTPALRLLLDMLIEMS